MGWPKGKKRGPMSAATKAKISAAHRIHSTGSVAAAKKQVQSQITAVDNRLADLKAKLAVSESKHGVLGKKKR